MRTITPKKYETPAPRADPSFLFYSRFILVAPDRFARRTTKNAIIGKLRFIRRTWKSAIALAALCLILIGGRNSNAGRSPGLRSPDPIQLISKICTADTIPSH
jgi:hypothetical protein